MTKNLNRREYSQTDYHFPGVSRKKLPVDLREPIYYIKMATSGSWKGSTNRKKSANPHQNDAEKQKSTNVVEKTDSLLKKTACSIKYRYPTSFQKTAPSLSSKDKLREAERDRLMQKLSNSTPECMKRGTFYSEQPRRHNCTYGVLPYNQNNKSISQRFGRSSLSITYILNHKIGSNLLKERYSKSTKNQNNGSLNRTENKVTFDDSTDAKRNGTYNYSYAYDENNDNLSFDDTDSYTKDTNKIENPPSLSYSDSGSERKLLETLDSSRNSTARPVSSRQTTDRSTKRSSVRSNSKSDDDLSIAKSYEKELYALDSEFESNDEI
ncbi:unnamed protein product [Dimorphilus gyrociliatus]|uniref:Uncharacterized protein n=1 Tax=Dimorphilus gyrociliatus TaxID=2664684 RepID=A0A7I8VW75_9ANNE|nr:unnamed protein product [Dimorphilus gyrociliatus]